MGGSDDQWRELSETQAGVIARRQLLGLGMTARQARRWLDSEHWRQIHPGVYATFTGPVDGETRIWAGILWAGPGAVAGHRSALWLGRVTSDLGERVDVCIPHERRVVSGPGVRIHRVRDLAGRLHPASSPPRVRLEVAILDTAEDCDEPDQVMDVVLRAIQRRLTTANRISRQLRDRPRHRWRKLLLEILAEASVGVASPLEFRYARDVERAHGLPRGLRNKAEGERGRRRYHDVRYEEFGLLVELDGREAHPPEEAFRDLRRDNAATAAGDRVLRYGWRDVVGRACAVAAQVGTTLQTQGWSGHRRRCSPSCPVANS